MTGKQLISLPLLSSPALPTVLSVLVAVFRACTACYSSHEPHEGIESLVPQRNEVYNLI